MEEEELRLRQRPTELGLRQVCACFVVACERAPTLGWVRRVWDWVGLLHLRDMPPRPARAEHWKRNQLQRVVRALQRQCSHLDVRPYLYD